MATYAFRLRFYALRDILPATPDGQPIVLGSSGVRLTIEHGGGTRPDRVILGKGGFGSAELATAAAFSTKAALRTVAVALNVPLQLAEERGWRPIGWSPDLLAAWQEIGAGEERGDPQFDVYEETDPPPTRTRIEAEGYVQRQIEAFTAQLEADLAAPDGEIGERLATASELYLSTTFETSHRAKFLNLVTVLEVLAVRTERPADELELIDRWLTDVQRANLPQPHKDSLRTSIKALRERSIGASIKALVASDETPRYLGKSPTAFVTDCYTIRSEMTHDGVEPANANLRETVAPLDDLVQRLLLRRLRTRAVGPLP